MPRTVSSLIPSQVLVDRSTQMSPAGLAVRKPRNRQRGHSQNQPIPAPVKDKRTGRFVSVKGSCGSSTRRPRHAPTPASAVPNLLSAATATVSLAPMTLAPVSVASVPSDPLNFLPDSVNNFLDQVFLETNSASFTAPHALAPPITEIAAPPASFALLVTPELLAEEIFQKIILPRIQSTCQLDALNSFRADFYRQWYEQSLKTFLSERCGQAAMTYSQIDSLIVQAVANLGIL